MRNKIENVVLSEDIFMVHGILDDDIYSIELDLEIDSKTLVITEAKGKWHRHTIQHQAILFHYLFYQKQMVSC
ncbi:MAG: hypothetical protein GY760_15205 [Deltaproteobacteria bacterium]|nr:hypothetical protein [Deltaproteobacteria bacterium]